MVIIAKKESNKTKIQKKRDKLVNFREKQDMIKSL